MVLPVNVNLTALYQVSNAKAVAINHHNELILNGIVLGTIIDSQPNTFTHLVSPGFQLSPGTTPTIYNPLDKCSAKVTRGIE